MKRPGDTDPATRESSDYDNRFERRLEAFSDIVFGFSISLLATRLEVPANPAGILDASRVLPLVVTFGLICVMWLQHYQIFNHYFVGRPPDVVLNFLFLFALALLPYCLQTFMRFPAQAAALELYFADVSVIFITLATLRLRGLLQRSPHLRSDLRLKDCQRVAAQYLLAVLMIVTVAGVATRRVVPPYQEGPFALAMVATLLIGRLAVRRVPAFLAPSPE